MKIRYVIAVLALAAFFAPMPVGADAAGRNTYARLVKEGFERVKARDYQAARGLFDDALKLDDAAPEARFGLGLVYFHQNEFGLAERELLRVIETAPREAAAYQILGEIAYRKDDFETALSRWEKAVALNPADAALRGRIDRVRREHAAEKDFNRDVTSHFLIKYEGREKIEAGRIVLRALEDAYGEVGRALSFYPDREIQVILYSEQQFQEVTDAPGWSSGIYDGKIRIPIGGIDRETPGLRRLLFHEYTHAVVRAISPRTPTWLNEGLAQYFEGRELDQRQREALRGLARNKQLPPLSALEGSFMRLNSGQAHLAYAVSLSALRYLVDSHGLYRARMLLDEFAAGSDAAKAISNALLLSAEDFERGWLRSLD